MNKIQFAIIPPQILLREDLSIQDKMIFGIIDGLTGKYGYCFASNQQIGKAVSLSADRVSKIISSLAKRGCLKVELTKTKKTERTGSIGEKYGTTRKLYTYFKNTANPIGVDNQRGVGVDNQYNQTIKDNIYKGVVTNQRDSVSPNLSVPKKNPSLASNLKAKAERKANKGAWKNGINKPFKTTTSTLKLGRTDGLAISLTDNVDVPALMVKHGLSEELVLECKEAYNNWIMGSSYDSKVWGKDMNIYVDRFCKQKVAKAKSKDSKNKDMFEEINDIYKAFD